MAAIPFTLMLTLSVASAPAQDAPSLETQPNDTRAQVPPANVTDAVFEAFVALQDHRSELGQDAWASAMRDLIELGPEAVPELVTALDETDDQYLMRCVVFALRGIGDKRVIPDLIRAIPKTLQPSGSDYGLHCDDPELMKFMIEHDVDAESRHGSDEYHFGRPVTEVLQTLRQWTGESIGFADIIFVQRHGALTQQAQQEHLYLEVAKRWKGWWGAHWQEYVDEPALAKIELPESKLSVGQPEFPTGPGVVSDSVISGVIASVLETSDFFPPDFPTMTLFDIDTGRFVRWPESLPPPGEIAGHEAELEAWAAREGIDLMGTQYTPPGSDQSFYVLRSFGMRAWQIEVPDYDRLENQLRAGHVKLGQPTAGFLTDYDPQTVRFHPERPAAFLFITREGTHGALHVVCQVTKPVVPGQRNTDPEAGPYSGVRIRSQVLYVPEDDE